MNNEIHKNQQQSVDSSKPGFVMPDNWHCRLVDARYGPALFHAVRLLGWDPSGQAKRPYCVADLPGHALWVDRIRFVNTDAFPGERFDMNPKTKAILDQVKILAQTYPDFVYAADHNHGILCKYNVGGDPKYPELYGCIIGQAARRAGIDTSDWDSVTARSDDKGSYIESRIGNRLNESPHTSEAYILAKIQKLQDRGVPWGEAYAKAMTQVE